MARIPGGAGPYYGPDAQRSQADMIRARIKERATQDQWTVASWDSKYWPGDYRLAERPPEWHDVHTYAIPYQKLNRDCTVTSVRTYNGQSSNAAMAVGVYRVEGRRARLAIATVFDLNNLGHITVDLPHEFTFYRGVQYYLAVSFDGVLDNDGPQVAVSHMDAPPIFGICELSVDTMPSEVSLGLADAEEIHEFPAFVFLNEIAEELLKEGVIEGMASYGEMYVSSASATTVTTGDTFYKVAGTTTAAILKDFTMPTDNRLQYTGGSTKVFDVDITISCSQNQSGATKYTEWAIAKNGSVITQTQIQRDHSSANDRGSVALTGLVSLDQNDYIEVFVTHETSSQTATAHQMIVNIHD